jgi:tRNA A-37 threonylcarbamoyl transferase component Bud32/tetratricopeptide (TPR) repeat protein
MASEPTAASDQERQLDEVIASYLEAEESGQALDPETLLSRHPELAAGLRQFFANREQLDRLAAPLRSLVQSPGAEEVSPPGDLAVDFGGYTLLTVLAQGGMGVVFKARQKSPNRLVALKSIRADRLASDSDVRRFRNEAETVANLDHPHIVPIYEVGEANGQLYFSMKLMEGGSLGEHLRQFQNDPKAAARLLITIARAVHHAHQRGVLHRDLKPSNILLDTRGQAHVSDFGLAKRVGLDATLTDTGAIVGSPSYMAPEQARGKKGTTTTATDVYGLGAILYAVLAGRPPFQDDTPLDTLAQVQGREPERLSGLNRHVDRDLETICLKCLEKEPNRRYASAEAVADDLERWLAGKPIAAQSVGRLEQLWRWCKRNRALAVAVSLISFAMCAVTVMSILFAIREAAHAQLLKEEKEQTEAALDKAKTHRLLEEETGRRAMDSFGTIIGHWDPRAVQSREQLVRAQLESLLTAERFYKWLIDEENPDPAVRMRTSRAYLGLAKICSVRNDPEREEYYHSKWRATVDQLVTDYPDDAGFAREIAGRFFTSGALAHLRGNATQAHEHFGRAAAQYRRVLALNPDIHALDGVAWFLVNCPDETFRDIPLALTIAQEILPRQPRNDNLWFLLAISQYRSGLWHEAIATADKAAKLFETPDPWSLLAAAASHHKLGEPAEARRKFAQADAFIRRERSGEWPLEKFRSEVALVLGVSQAAGHPADKSPRTRR